MTTTRDSIRAQLSQLYVPYYDALCELLPEDEWAPYQGLRTFDHQAQLFASGRSRPGRIITYADAGYSAHNYGMASDWAPWKKGKFEWPNPADPRWQVYGAAVEKAGLKWGGHFNKFIDCPHNELVIKVGWGTLKDVFLSQGLSGVERKLREGA